MRCVILAAGEVVGRWPGDMCHRCAQKKSSRLGGGEENREMK